MAKMLRGDDSMPFCDKEWIHPIEETQNGWWIPFIGFVSDARMSDNIKRAKAFMAKAGK